MATKISKRWLINFFLIFMIICLSYVGNKYNVQPGYKTDSRITTIKADDVNNILIQTADQRIQFVRSQNGWDMASPMQVRANPIKVERLLGITNITTDSRLAVTDADLQQFGLALHVVFCDSTTPIFILVLPITLENGAMFRSTRLFS